MMSNKNQQVKYMNEKIIKKTYDDDLFQRNETLGNNLVKILQSYLDRSLVVAINGAWGTGKTTFLEMWTNDLQSNLQEDITSYNIIEFNAWENDYIDDPLISLISEITEKKTKLDKTLKDIKRIGLNLSLKYLSKGAWTVDDFIADKLASQDETKINEFFASVAAEKKLLKDFKATLAEMADAKPILFIVDELDRCKPTYSVKFLERIKHLFDVPNISFVLAIDKEQLGISIQSVYGNINIDGYLRRFLNLTIDLPEVKPSVYIKELLKESYNQIILDQYNLNGNSYLEDVFTYFADVCKFSLRDVELLVRHLILAISTVPEKLKIHPLEVSTLICLKVHDDKLYHDFCHAKILAKDLLRKLFTSKHEFIEDSEEDKRRQRFNEPYITAVLYFLTPNERQPPASTEAKNIYEKMLNKEELPEPDKQRLQKVYKHIEMIDELHSLQDLKQNQS